MSIKPVCFLDFDYTLFDTDKLYAYLGEPALVGIMDILADRVPEPDFRSMLFPETEPALALLCRDFSPVLLTYSVNTVFQKMKIEGTGLYFDDTIITQGEKGDAARAYLARTKTPVDLGHIFVDDTPGHHTYMKKALPNVYRVLVTDEGEDIAPDIADVRIRSIGELPGVLAKRNGRSS